MPGQVRPEALVPFAFRYVEHSKIDYLYDTWHVAALPTRDFAFLPERLGYVRESVPCRDRDGVRKLVKRHVDAGRPPVCTIGDGALVYGYRVKDGTRQVWVDGTICLGWTDLKSIHPMDTCDALVKRKEPQPRREMFRDALALAVQSALPRGRQAGLGALEAYLADVKDPKKDFKRVGEWFCWATFERLQARWCCAAWLRRAAEVLGRAREPLLAAARHYEAAFKLYDEYRRELHADLPVGLAFRAPEHIAIVAPILQQGIEAERKGVAEMRKALQLLRTGG